jgi:hypothetical protein
VPVLAGGVAGAGAGGVSSVTRTAGIGPVVSLVPIDSTMTAPLG